MHWCLGVSQKAARVVGLYFPYSWKLSDEIEVNVGSAPEWVRLTLIIWGILNFRCWGTFRGRYLMSSGLCRSSTWELSLELWDLEAGNT